MRLLKRLCQSKAETRAVGKNIGTHEQDSHDVLHQIQSVGIQMEKSWSAVDDACGVCRANADAGWIPVDQPYPSGHMHPLAHDGCRCCDLYRVKG